MTSNTLRITNKSDTMKNIYSGIQERAKLTKENFDFTSGMSKLFSSNFQGIRDIPDLPIEASTTEWEEVSDFKKTSLRRTFSFERHKHLRFFVNEILKTSEEMQHHPALIITSETVQVELYTHDINEVSELDLKLARFIDEIYDDVKFIQEF